MIGAVIGDIVGSRFEFNNLRSKKFKFLHEDCFFTDDTVMTYAIAQAVMDTKGNYDNLSELAIKSMKEIGKEYPDCGYGLKFIKWINSKKPKPYNSMGNGAAMRVSSVAWVSRSIEETKELSYKVTAVSHNHPKGIEGAECTAVCIYMALHGAPKEDIYNYTKKIYNIPQKSDINKIRRENIYNELCDPCVPQAIQCFLASKDFEDAIRNCISIGGDSDTIAAIGGSIAEAYYGVPKDIEEKAVGYLDKKMRTIYESFNEYVKG